MRFFPLGVAFSFALRPRLAILLSQYLGFLGYRTGGAPGRSEWCGQDEIKIC